MNLKSLLCLTALAGATAAFAEDSTPVTLNWNLSEAVATAAAQSDCDGVSATLTVGSAITPDGNGSWNGVGKDVEFGTIDYAKYKIANDGVGGRKDEQYFEFAVNTAGTFTAEKISFTLFNQGWGDGRYDVVAVAGNVEKTLTTAANPGRDRNDNAISPFQSYTLSGLDAVEGTPLSIRIYYYCRNNDASTRSVGINDIVITGSFTGEIIEKPEIDVPAGAVVAPLAAGTFYDVTQAICTVANAKNDNIENTKKGTEVEFPFYVLTEGNYYLYFESGSKISDGIENIGMVNITLDGADLCAHEVKPTGGWSNYANVTVVPTGVLTPGKHVFKAVRDENTCLGSYAGNWRLSIHADEVYDHENINLAAGKDLATGQGVNIDTDGSVGWIKNGTSTEHVVYVSETGSYNLIIGINSHAEGTCTVTIKEEGISAIFNTHEIQARAMNASHVVELGDIATPGLKTIKLDFAADHGDFICNYGDMSLLRVGDVAGVEAAETAAEIIATEYYNLQGVRVDANAKGTLIRVATAADGSRTATKVFVR